jgi:photosystem II stability/assembly factor-like uncharacterized protein
MGRRGLTRRLWLPIAVWLWVPLTAAMGQWKYIGPDGGAVGAVAQHPTDVNILYVTSAANYNTNLFRSTDRGQSWAAIGFVNTRADMILVDRTNPQAILTCGLSGMRKSTNGGVTWSYLAGPSSISVQALCVDPTNSAVLHVSGYSYATTVLAAYGKSTDRGTTWNSKILSTGQAGMTAVAMDAVDPQVVYVGGYVNDPTYGGKLFKSTDGGTTFTDRTGTITGAINHILCDPTVSGKVFVASDAGIYRSTDGGSTWAMNNGYVPYPYELAKSPANASVLLAGTLQNGAYRSTDGGVNWQAASTGITSQRISTVLIDRGNASWMFAGTNAGLCRSSDGGTTWQAVNTGLQMASVSTLAFAPSSRSRVYAGVEPDGVFKTSNALGSGAVTWQPVGSFVSCRNTVPGVVVSNTNPDSVFVLEGGG